MGCCFCCYSQDMMIRAVLLKLEAVRAALAQPNDTKFIVGRVGLLDNHLISPVKGLPCAYFELEVDELVTRQVKKQRQVGENMVEYMDNEDTWQHRFTEVRCCDFFLTDYYNGSETKIFIPASTSSVKFYSKEDAGGDTSKSMGFFQSNYNPSPLMEEILSRHGMRSVQFFGISISKPRIRFREASFDKGEPISILGNLTDEKNNGSNRTLRPATSSSLSAQYFETNGWTDNEKKSWLELTKMNCYIGTDDQQYMKGVSV